MNPYHWAVQRDGADLIEGQSIRMADAMERQGYPAYQTGQDLSLVNLVDGSFTKIVSFRNTTVLPAVAQKNRRKLQYALSYWMENERKTPLSHFKYFTFTSGQRVKSFGPLGERMTLFNRQLKLVRDSLFPKYGFKCQFIGLEFPWDPDQESYNLHANMIVETTQKLTRAEYNEFRMAVEEIMVCPETGDPAIWRNNGKIENIREFIKYPFKPQHIADASDEEIVWLAQQTKGRQIVRLQGDVSDMRRDWEDAGLTVMKTRDQFILRQKSHSQMLENDEGTEKDKAEAKADKKGGAGENIIVARVMPNFAETPWAVPYALVSNYNPQPLPHRERSLKRLETLSSLMADAHYDYAESGAPDWAIAKQIAAAARVALHDEAKVSNVRALWPRARETRCDAVAISAAADSYQLDKETIIAGSDYRREEHDCSDLENPDTEPSNVVPFPGSEPPSPPPDDEPRTYLSIFGVFQGETRPWWYESHDGRPSVFAPDVLR